LRPDDWSETIDKAATDRRFDEVRSFGQCIMQAFQTVETFAEIPLRSQAKCDGNSRAGEETGMKTLILAEVATAVLTATSAAVRREWQR
jgi:hypothetical protein